MNIRIRTQRVASRIGLIAPPLALALLVAACGMTESIREGGGPGNLPERGVAKHALVQLDNCGELETYSKKAAIQRMMAYAEVQRKQLESCWGGDNDSIGVDMEDDWGGGDSPSSVDGDADGDVDADMGSDSNAGESDGSGKTGGSHSETNVQEEGVDEADLIKTDGKNLYALTGDTLVVIAAGDDGSLTELGRLAVGGFATELFLYKDLVVVFSELGRQDVPDEMKMSRPEWAKQSEEYPTEWDSEWDFYRGGYSQVAIVDVSTPASPTLSRTIKYAGSYVTSRRIGGTLRAVISTTTPALDIPYNMDAWYYCSMPESMGRAVFEAAYSALIAEAEKLIDDLTIDEILPKKQDIIGDAVTTDSIVECSDVYGPQTAAGTGLLTVVSLDLDNPKKRQKDVGIFGERGLVYASQSSLYLTTSKDYAYNAWRSGLWSQETSGVHKFDIATDPSQAIYKASGSIEGRMLNQFCLGEHNGFLRVATTTGDRWNVSTWDNHVSVFEEKNGKLEMVGHVGGIGKEEQEEIYAARFLGDRGFLVTFRQTDPLFTLDMSDPYDPKVVGEWHGPGYSTYLHPYGENHIIAVGREDWRIALSLYDLTDFSNPKMVERHFLGEEGGMESAALNNHKAFSFDAERDLLLMPFHGWNYNKEYDEGGYDTGILLFNVSLDGFAEAGRLSLAGDNPQNRDEGQAQRSAYIGDVLYGISRCRITSANINAPSVSLDTIKLYTGDWCNQYGSGNETDVDWEEGWDGGDIDVDIDGDADADWDTGGEEVRPDEPEWDTEVVDPENPSDV